MSGVTPQPRPPSSGRHRPERVEHPAQVADPTPGQPVAERPPERRPVPERPRAGHLDVRLNGHRDEEADEHAEERQRVAERTQHLSAPRGPAPRCGSAPGWRADPLRLAEPADEDRALALGVQIGEHHGDRLAHDPAAVDDHPVVAAQRQPRPLQLEQLLGRAVDGDLLVVLLPAARPAVRSPAERLPAGLPDPGRRSRGGSDSAKSSSVDGRSPRTGSADSARSGAPVSNSSAGEAGCGRGRGRGLLLAAARRAGPAGRRPAPVRGVAPRARAFPVRRRDRPWSGTARRRRADSDADSSGEHLLGQGAVLLGA